MRNSSHLKILGIALVLAAGLVVINGMATEVSFGDESHHYWFAQNIHGEGKYDIVDINHIYQEQSEPINRQGVTAKKITIQEDVWIGSGRKILKGVTLVKGAIVGGGSVVTKDVLSYHAVVGNPANTIKERGK